MSSFIFTTDFNTTWINLIYVCSSVLDTVDIISVIKNLGNATAFADQATAELQIFRTQTGVIEKLTTPVLFTRKP